MQRENFGSTNLFFFGNGNFLTCWNMNNYHITYSNMFVNGIKYKMKSRAISLSLYGLTKGATNFPQFIRDDERSYHTTKPGNKGWKVGQSFWFLHLIKYIEEITIQYFDQLYPEKKKQ